MTEGFYRDDFNYLRDGEGRILPLLYNIYITLRFHPEWKYVIQAEFSDQGEMIVVKAMEPPYSAGVDGEAWSECDTALTTIWLQRNEILVDSDQVATAVKAVAVTNSQVNITDDGPLI